MTKPRPLELPAPGESGLRGRTRARFALAFDGQHYRLGDRPLHVGRSSDAHIVLTGPLVSRRHASFRATDAGVEVTDHGSRNGIFVNGERVYELAPLRVGDVVTIGADSFTVVALDASAPQPAMRAALKSDTRALDPSPPRLPSVPAADLSASSRRAEAFQLLGAVVDKALALGRGEEAEHLIGQHLVGTLSDASQGQGVAPEIARAAAVYALKLAAAMHNANWLNFPLRLYAALSEPMPLPIVDELYTLLGRVRGLDRSLLRAYVDGLRADAPSFSPTERFVLQRLEGLERVAALQSERA